MDFDSINILSLPQNIETGAGGKVPVPFVLVSCNGYKVPSDECKILGGESKALR